MPGGIEDLDIVYVSGAPAGLRRGQYIMPFMTWNSALGQAEAPPGVTVSAGGVTGITQTQLAALISSLPTTLPGSAGVAWNNGGVLTLST